MQVSVEDKTSVKKILHIEIPVDQVTGELDEAYKDLKKTAKIDGFRPGKAPRQVLVKKYGKDINQDVRANLIEKAFMDAIKEKDLSIVGNPEIDPPDLDPKGPYKFDAAIEIKPVIDDLDYKGMALKKNIYKISDKELDNQLKALQKNMAKLEPIEGDRPAQNGDAVLVDYQGFQDGKPHPKLQKTENTSMKIGDEKLLGEFSSNLVGMKTGEEKDFDLTFPEDYFVKELAGQAVSIHASLKEIRKEILPELDDELAKKMGNFQSLDELKQAMMKNMKEGYDKRTEHELSEQVFETIISKVDFEVPDALIDFELDGILSESDQALKAKNLTLEDIGKTREELAVEYRGTAEKQARRHLILDKIINQAEIELLDDELEDGLKEMAGAMGVSPEVVKQVYKTKESNLDAFKQTLLEKKAMRLIIEDSIVEDVELEAGAE